MTSVNKTENGMFTGKRVFFDCVKSNLVDKVKRILKRLEAEIIDQYDIDIHLVIIDYDKVKVIQSNERKRKIYTSLLHQSKKMKYSSNIITDLSTGNTSNASQENAIQRYDSVGAKILTLAKEKGAKIKSVKEVWQWLNKYYKLLIENDEPDELVNLNSSFVKYNRIQVLGTPALKIIDPLGGTRPQILENYLIDKNLWCEFKSNDFSKSIELKRSTGTSKKFRKSKDANCGYCECCHETYQDLFKHLTSEQHQTFVADDSSFKEIDKLISRGPTVSTFLSERKQLLEKHKLSKISLQQLPKLPQRSVFKEEKIPENKPTLEIVVEDLMNNPEANASSSSSSGSTTDSSSSSGSTNSLSSEASSNDDFYGNHCISSTPIGKSNKPNFLTADSISAEDNQLQISQHVDYVIENLSFQLSNDNFLDCSGAQNSVPKLRNRCEIEDNSPVLSRRFDWCDKCSRNHVPVAKAQNFQCLLSPMKKSGFVQMASGLDIETANGMEIISDKSLEDHLHVPCQLLKITGKGTVPSVVIEKIDENHKLLSPEMTDSDNIIETTKQLLVNIDKINLNSPETCFQSELSFISQFDKVERPDLGDMQLLVENLHLQSDLENLSEKSKCCSLAKVKNGDFVNERSTVGMETGCNYEINRRKLLSKINRSCSSKVANMTDVSKILLVNIDKLNLNSLLEHSTEKSIMEVNSTNAENIGSNWDFENTRDRSESSKGDDLMLFDGEHNKENSELLVSGSSIFCGNMEINEVDNLNRNVLPSSPRSVKTPRQGLVLLETLESPTGKRRAAISANVGIINSNRFFKSSVRQIIETVRDSCEVGIYNPEILIKKLNFSSK